MVQTLMMESKESVNRRIRGNAKKNSAELSICNKDQSKRAGLLYTSYPEHGMALAGSSGAKLGSYGNVLYAP